MLIFLMTAILKITFLFLIMFVQGGVAIKDKSFIGAGSIIKDNITIGKKKFVDTAGTYVHI